MILVKELKKTIDSLQIFIGPNMHIDIENIKNHINALKHNIVLVKSHIKQSRINKKHKKIRKSHKKELYLQND